MFLAILLGSYIANLKGINLLEDKIAYDTVLNLPVLPNFIIAIFIGSYIYKRILKWLVGSK